MKIAIHQPNFLPWIGFFHKIMHVDIFVFFDDVQLPRGKSYCSRTKILADGEEAWLTIPIVGKSNLSLIKDVKVNSDTNWKRKHLKTLELNYRKAACFEDVFPIMERVYNISSDFLIDYNISFITELLNFLDLHVEFIRSSNILPSSEKKV